MTIDNWKLPRRTGKNRTKADIAYESRMPVPSLFGDVEFVAWQRVVIDKEGQVV